MTEQTEHDRRNNTVEQMEHDRTDRTQTNTESIESMFSGAELYLFSGHFRRPVLFIVETMLTWDVLCVLCLCAASEVLRLENRTHQKGRAVRKSKYRDRISCTWTLCLPAVICLRARHQVSMEVLDVLREALDAVNRHHVRLPVMCDVKGGMIQSLVPSFSGGCEFFSDLWLLLKPGSVWAASLFTSSLPLWFHTTHLVHKTY